MVSNASSQLLSEIRKLNYETLEALTCTIEKNPMDPLVGFFHVEGDRYTRALRKLSPDISVPEIGTSINSPFMRSTTFSYSTILQESVEELIETINRRCLEEADRKSPCFRYREFTGEQLMAMLPSENDGRMYFLNDIVVKRVRKDLVALQEPANLQHIRILTTIPVPHVIRVHTHLQAAYVFMSHIPGVTLEEVWQTMSSHVKQRVTTQLRTMMTHLRSVSPPSPCYFGSIESHICLDARLITRVTVGTKGFITSEEEFNKLIMTDLKTRFNDEYYFMLLSMARKDHKIVLTHADFHPRNIMIEDGNVTGIIDWSYAGWYPEHWEYVKALMSVGSIVDWWRYLPNIMESYYSEWAIDHQMQQVMRMR